ncbi:hypothetical protein JCM8097_008473 [Rhodosporidiobolus ruineniae]
MYETMPAPAFGERERSTSAGSSSSFLQTAAPTGRTIYSYSAPSSPYPGYPSTEAPRYVATATPTYSSAPCNCADCYSAGPSVPSVSSYVSAPYPSGPTYVPTPPLPIPPGSYQAYGQPEQPLYRSVAVRPDTAESYTYRASPPLSSPPTDDVLPRPEPLFYHSSASSWAPQPNRSPPSLQAPFVENQSWGRPTYAPPETPLPPSQHLLTPFALRTNLDRRRSSAGSSVYDAPSLSRRSSALSLGSPYDGSERSAGSDEERHEAVTPFMSKLHYLLNSPDFSEFIRWDASGTAFVFAHSTEGLANAFSKVFRHNNSHSFVRQLNIYDFKRLTSLELHAAVESAPFPYSPLTSADFAGFSHPLFYRDSPQGACDLARLKPKMGKKPSTRNLAAQAKLSPSVFSSLGNNKPRSLRSEGKGNVALKPHKG